jgi:DNA invertase Pin-like site-specific DNA recombinase
LATIVDIYCRVSTDPQDDNTSHEEQERSAREYCRAQGFVVGIVHHETFSGFVYRERKKLTLMRERYREGKIQGVVVRTFDRLSRRQAHAAILMEEMDYHGVQFHCVMEPVNTEDKAMEQFVRMILAFVAE